MSEYYYARITKLGETIYSRYEYFDKYRRKQKAVEEIGKPLKKIFLDFSEIGKPLNR